MESKDVTQGLSPKCRQADKHHTWDRSCIGYKCIIATSYGERRLFEQFGKINLFNTVKNVFKSK